MSPANNVPLPENVEATICGAKAILSELIVLASPTLTKEAKAKSNIAKKAFIFFIIHFPFEADIFLIIASLQSGQGSILQ